MTTVIAERNPAMEHKDTERWLSQKLHDLRTPLNQIIGFSEILIEIAEEEGHRNLIEGLMTVRNAGYELTNLVHDRNLFTVEPRPGREYWTLADASRAAVCRITAFIDLVLAGAPDPRLSNYAGDLEKVRTAAINFADLAASSGLLMMLETSRQWEGGNAPASLQPSEIVEAPKANGRVLIVDDEELNREILCRRLERESYLPTGASSGPEALGILRREAFDVILLDIVMPEMSGMEVLQILKQDPALRHLPVIMLSGLTDVERVARCIELGAEDYLPKPINSVLLRARLGACLEKKRFRDQEQAHFEALHAEKERLSVTLRSLADAVAATDAVGNIILLNDVAAALTGISRDEATGRPFDEVFRIYHRENGRPVTGIISSVITRNAVVESEPGIAIMQPDGVERLVSVRSAPIHDQEGAIRGMVVVVRDITEKEKMAEELLRASKLQSIGVLAGGLAHDFNNMLTAVVGNLSLIRQRPALPPEALSLLRQAEGGAQRVQELTRYLLTFSEGGAPIKQLLQAKKLIRETSAFVARGSNVNCEFDLPPELWEAEADPNQLAQVVSNIVLNAIEAMPSGGKIRVSGNNATAPLATAPSLAPGDYLCITIQDQGTGIAPEHLSRIYDPFFTTKKQSRGLGLAAAYSIIQRHGGHISIESKLGVGTTVSFYVPAVRSSVPVSATTVTPGQEISDEETPAAKPEAGKRRVLIMDDDESIRMLTGMMFKQLNYEVVATTDGDSALAAHKEAIREGRAFDLVVMDLTIPGGMGGKEAIRRLREVDQTILTIVSSGYSNDPVMANHADYGFNGVLPKPFTMSDLIRVVRELIPA